MLLHGINVGNSLVKYEHISKKADLSLKASITNYSFSLRFFYFNSKTYCKYRTPPWTNLVDLLEAPEPKSLASKTTDFNPLVAHSNATPAPVAPPPIIITSYWFDFISFKWVARSFKGY